MAVLPVPRSCHLIAARACALGFVLRLPPASLSLWLAVDQLPVRQTAQKAATQTATKTASQTSGRRLTLLPSLADKTADGLVDDRFVASEGSVENPPKRAQCKREIIFVSFRVALTYWGAA